jgi:hypothetical protein
MRNLKTNNNASLTYKTGYDEIETLDINNVKDAVIDCHGIIDLILKDIPVDIFSVLGMRNLSAFIGELFAKSLERVCNGLYKSNPHQDGYPDLLLMNAQGLKDWENLKKSNSLREKSPFSPFRNGGLEIKATCGSVPSPQDCTKKGITKPDIGDTRIDVLKGYDWKAHHRETTNLIGLLWDFDNTRAPRIVAVFFGNNMTEEDWGTIVKPKEGGGRTTSVSIMSRTGVKRMYENWLVVIDETRYIKFLNNYNNGQLIK